MSKRKYRGPELPRKMDFRMDEALYNRIVNAANAAGISHGEYIRRQLTKGKVVVRKEYIADVPQLRALIAEFGKIGSNLNQIAHYYNGGGSRSREMFDRTQQAISELYAMKYEVEKMGGEFFSGYSKAHTGKKQ